MELSILIPTLVSRQAQFQSLYDDLCLQISKGAHPAEVIHLSDEGQAPIGRKRNRLLERASGRFIAFVDDDDAVSPNYVGLICAAIRENPGIDCVGIRGLITFRGGHPHPFVHSLRYRRYFKRDGVYYRPPMHINPIRRSIAARYRFEEIDYSEDMDWAWRIWRDRALQTEALIEEPLYFYRSGRSWRYQVWIDRTESLRQVLGLQLSNRVRLRRWLREIGPR